MANVNIVIHGKKQVSPKMPFSIESPEDNRYGFWGMVTELHPENGTVHVRTPEGRIISNVKVFSDEWVTIDEDKGFLSGERDLPPIDTHVLVFMPNGRYSSAVIIASGFSTDPQHKAFFEDSEDAKEISDKVKNSGWKYTEDKRTGTRVLQNKPEDPTIVFEIDQETEDDEKVKITIHKNIFTVEKDEGIYIETDKNIKIKIEKNKEEMIEGDQTKHIVGDENRAVDGSRTTVIMSDEEHSVTGNYDWNIGGSLNINVGGSVKINGATINLN